MALIFPARNQSSFLCKLLCTFFKNEPVLGPYHRSNAPGLVWFVHIVLFGYSSSFSELDLDGFCMNAVRWTVSTGSLQKVSMGSASRP
jgi:hypothetical protein